LRTDDTGDVIELAESIAEQGVLEPAIVITIGAFKAANPGKELPMPDARWILLAGHRRRAGSLAAKKLTLPSIVRDDLAGDRSATLAMLLENVQRADLSPLEQGRGFAKLRNDHQMSVRQIGKALGVSPGQVSKRISLLKLPDAIQAALAAGELSVAAALRLLELPGQAEITSAWTVLLQEPRRTIDQIVDSRLLTLQRQKAIDEASRAAESEGASTVASAGAADYDPALTPLCDPGDIDTAKEQGPLIAAPDSGRGDVRYCTNQSPEEPAGLSTRETAIREQAQSHDARVPVLKGFLRRGTSPAVAAEVLTHAVLRLSLLSGIHSRPDPGACREYCGLDAQPSSSNPDEIENDGEFVERVTQAGGVSARKLALAMLLLSLEQELTTADPAEIWPRWSIWYLQILASNAGHTITEYEKNRLKENP
jgi:ParB/RepB/Spo0J family partition protein